MLILWHPRLLTQGQEKAKQSSSSSKDIPQSRLSEVISPTEDLSYT